MQKLKQWRQYSEISLHFHTHTNTYIWNTQSYRWLIHTADWNTNIKGKSGTMLSVCTQLGSLLTSENPPALQSGIQRPGHNPELLSVCSPGLQQTTERMLQTVSSLTTNKATYAEGKHIYLTNVCNSNHRSPCVHDHLLTKQQHEWDLPKP